MGEFFLNIDLKVFIILKEIKNKNYQDNHWDHDINKVKLNIYTSVNIYENDFKIFYLKEINSSAKQALRSKKKIPTNTSELHDDDSQANGLSSSV